MNFFEHQQQARRSSTLLVFLFGFAVLAIVLAVNFASVSAYRIWSEGQGRSKGHYEVDRRGNVHRRTDPVSRKPVEIVSEEETFVMGAATVATLFVILLGSLYRTTMLRAGGGSAVARMMGGRHIEPGSADPDERRLLNVVEEMAIAAGCNVPTVYVIDGEPGINAFAAGYAPSEASIVVSQGALKDLTRDELQGVVAHEFSHIFNGDMRTNIQMLGILNGILVIGLTGYWMVRLMIGSGHRRSRSSKDNGGGGVALFALLAAGILLVIIGYLGVFFGRLIKASLSRSREYLADASAVQFTRNPLGIAGALRKIQLGGGSYLTNRGTEELSHFFFADGVGFALPFFATHPPLKTRLDRILPNWEKEFPKPPPPLPGQSTAEKFDKMNAERLRKSVGTTNVEQLVMAGEILTGIPPILKKLSYLPQGAETILYALLCVEHEEVPMAEIRQVAGDSQHAHVLTQAHDLLRKSGEANWVPVANLCMPALQQLSETARVALVDKARSIVESDGHTTAFESSMLALLERSLAPESEKRQVQVKRLAQVRQEVISLCAILAQAGSSDPTKANAAFHRGVARAALDSFPTDSMPQTSAGLIPHLVKPLGSASPKVKETVMAALTEVAVSDGEISPHEAEILRAVSVAMDCPMPLLA